MSRRDEANKNTPKLCTTWLCLDFRSSVQTETECDSSSCTALTITRATRYPLLLKNPAGPHIYWSSEPIRHIIGLENFQHTHSNGAEGLIVHDNDGIHFNLVSVTFKQTSQIFFTAS